jgi:hypothetical protein
MEMTPFPTIDECAEMLRHAGWGVGEVEAGDGTWVVAAANRFVTLSASAATREEAWERVCAWAEDMRAGLCVE